jgi:LuxR family quorum-sensing system transcriptional regulator CciR
MIPLAQRLSELVDQVTSVSDLLDAMSGITQELGFTHFALAHHVDVRNCAWSAIRLHDYPARWADYYDERALGVSDPVHRASHVTGLGFRWSDMPRMIDLTRRDRQILADARNEGIGDGYTVPAHIPGEARGSCSFVNGTGRPLPQAELCHAQLAGTFAFEAARRLWLGRGNIVVPERRPLTDRQRDCLIWVARGKSDWEIAQILGLSPETVACHVSAACERYGVHKRTLVIILALFDGTLTFSDLVLMRHPPFPG